MAANVFAAAMRNSHAEGNDRNVLLALADCAWRDGVTWILVGDEKDDVDETICRLARVSKSTAIRSIGKLRDVLGEIQSVKVRRGRSFVTVYRVLHGAADVDYERIPFELPHRFDEPPTVQGVKSAPSIERVCEVQPFVRRDIAASLHGANLTPSTAPVHGVTDEGSRCQSEPVQGVKSDTFKVSAPRARERNPRTVSEPAAGTERESKELGSPAAAEPLTDREVMDREVIEAGATLPGWDIGSSKVVIPIAHGLPRSVFTAVVEVVRQRQGRVGLLVDLLKIARAERTAALSAQLAAELGATAPAYVPAPWVIDSLKREAPDRYTRIMASTPIFPVDLLREALHGRDDVDDLVDLFESVRAGAEPGDRLGTPEQERLRWVESHAADDDVGQVIDAWDDVDAIERQALHERADSLRGIPLLKACRHIADINGCNDCEVFNRRFAA